MEATSGSTCLSPCVNAAEHWLTRKAAAAVKSVARWDVFDGKDKLVRADLTRREAPANRQVSFHDRNHHPLVVISISRSWLNG